MHAKSCEALPGNLGATCVAFVVEERNTMAAETNGTAVASKLTPLADRVVVKPLAARR